MISPLLKGNIMESFDLSNLAPGITCFHIFHGTAWAVGARKKYRGRVLLGFATFLSYPKLVWVGADGRAKEFDKYPTIYPREPKIEV